MRALLPALVAAGLFAGTALAAQPLRSDQIKRDGDPYRAGTPVAAAPQPQPADVTPSQTRMYSSVHQGQTRVTANEPIPDTLENRARFGEPLSAAGRRSKPKGN